LLTATAVTGPGAITPDKDIKTASNKKADSNNFYSLAEEIASTTCTGMTNDKYEISGYLF